MRKPRPLAVNKVALLAPPRSVQFSSVQVMGTQPRLPMLTGSSGTRPLDGRRRDRGLGFMSSLSRSFCLRVCLLSSPTFTGASMHFGSTFLSRLRMMLVGIWLGLYWVLFSFFDHYIKSSGDARGGHVVTYVSLQSCLDAMPLSCSHIRFATIVP